MNPTPVGILFPGFNIAGAVDPAALASGPAITSIQVAGAPPLSSGDPGSYFTSLSTNAKNIGWSVGYDGSIDGPTTVHHLFSGVGFDLGPVAFGIGLEGPIRGGFNPRADGGIIFHLSDIVHFGLSAFNVNNSVQTTIGIGLTHKKQDSVEFDVTLPPFNLPNGGYIGTFSATIYMGQYFGTNFRTSIHTETKDFDATLGGLVWILPSVNFALEITSPRQLTTAFTFIL
jgi:hypothetical protein